MEFSDTLLVQLTTYCVTLFRRIYFDVFHDYEYREDFSDKAALFRDDGVQLLDTIIFLTQKSQVVDLLRDIVKKSNTVEINLEEPSNDALDLTGDDKVMKHTYKSLKIQDTETKRRVFSELFENITEEQINSLTSRL